MSRSPNSEQLLAIEHTGGVLLRAGAGSGKTFVLVHHILYLTETWINQFKTKPFGSFEEFIREKFSQVAMMTFTKKAAGEMSIRLTEKFEEMATVQGEHQKFWQIANEYLPLLTVTTIDGFCRRLITLGYFPHLSTEAKIIFAPERTNQVSELVEEWFTLKSESVPQDILDIVIREKKSLLNAFTHVFSDPGLRLAWKKFELAEIHPDKVDRILSLSFKLNDLSRALLAIHNLDLPEEKERTSFEKIVATFQATGLPDLVNIDTFTIYANLFESISRIDNRKKLAAHQAAKDGLALLRDWVKLWGPVIGDYKSHYETKVLPWMKLCLELFNFIEDRLDPNQGMTFGDIEYFVALGLGNVADRERIQKTYSYFIVDEFQDTSDVQFRIIEGLIGGDFNKLFCVGDAKQAIYGFRGGELSVFQNCAHLVPQVRSLANNYRSHPEIIEFNNSLFKAILPLGYNYQGHDPFSVPPEDQNIPPEVIGSVPGMIQILTADLVGGERKISNEEMNRLEASVICNAIKKERETSSHICTVLYSKLRPSGELIRELMEQKIGFTAQFKIDLLDDPVLGIFLCLLRRHFDPNEETRLRYPLLLLESYFKILGLEAEVVSEHLDAFEQDIAFWGLVEAFRKFIFKLHFTNENSDINLQTIETISALYHQDPESVMTQLLKGDNDRLSLDLRYGENSHLVQIMSAHASKGLEFDSVYLAGIYTNGRENPDKDIFGDLPGSFKWYLDVSQKEKQKSPFLVYENELARYKNYSEGKRLFYVACTRAKKNLSWVDFGIPEKTFSIPKNSWILGLRAWWQETSLKVSKVKLESFNSEELLSSRALPQLPLFFFDPVGIFPKGSGEDELLIAAELSVTRLNHLVDCPRKFYLSNILKVTEPDSVKRFESDGIEENQEVEELASLLRSSSARGTQVHAHIAEGITRNFVVPRLAFETDLRKPVQWTLELLKNYQNDYLLVPEKQVKFKLFNFMISGIPDLILLPKVKKKLPAQIWDFKTGLFSNEKLSHYWLQLTTYAYALYQLGSIDETQEIELILCFVDEEKTLKKTLTRPETVEFLYPLWRSQNEPWKTNPEHCGQCSYGSICPR